MSEEHDGYADCYELNTEGFGILNLNRDYNILTWLAILIQNRTFHADTPLSAEVSRYLREKFYVETAAYDIVIGYRADDSCFSFAQDFLSGALSFQQLQRAMYLGELGEQIVLISPKAFSAIRFMDCERAFRSDWLQRDRKARAEYLHSDRMRYRRGELYAVTLLDQEIGPDDPRLSPCRRQIMIHSYDEIYTVIALTALGQMLRYALEDLQMGLNEFWDMFLISGNADLFGHGDFRFLVGMSGVETAWEVIWRMTGTWPQTQPSFQLEKSPVYWTGWILAWYQWYSGRSFRRIDEFLKPEQVKDMYSPYHEMDPLQFADAAEEIRRKKETATRLKMYRERIGLSQSELARESGGFVRMIQYYEQRRKDLDKAQAGTVYMLGRALGCSVENLLEL